MTLSYDRAQLEALMPRQLVGAILERRKVVRYLWDQKGDDRCFLDYYLVWELVGDSIPMPRFSAAKGMQHCERFYDNCRTEQIDRVPLGAFCELHRWDAHLPYMTRETLVEELLVIQQAIVWHRDVEIREGRLRTCDDDRKLCHAILPEQEPCDFRLPPRNRFLESADASSGCPAFWQSHAGCGSKCNLHQWGKCG